MIVCYNPESVLSCFPGTQTWPPNNSDWENSLLTARNLERDQALIREPTITYHFDIKCMYNVFWLCHWLALKMLNSWHEPQPGGCDIKTLRVLFTYAAWCPAWAAPPWTFALAALAGGLKAGKHRNRNKIVITGTQTAPTSSKALLKGVRIPSNCFDSALEGCESMIWNATEGGGGHWNRYTTASCFKSFIEEQHARVAALRALAWTREPVRDHGNRETCTCMWSSSTSRHRGVPRLKGEARSISGFFRQQLLWSAARIEALPFHRTRSDETQSAAAM